MRHIVVVADVLCPIVVGRAAELAELDSALQAALRGQGRVVCLTGEAGIGKSRLARELAATARSGGAVVGIGRGVPNGATTPYRALTEALLQCIRGREPLADAELAPWLPALGAIVPTLAGESAAKASSPVRAEAIIRLLSRLADPDGLVFVLEDLHWSDPHTLAIAEYLADNLTAAPVLFLMTARDDVPCLAGEVTGRLLGARSARHLAMERLDPALVVQMVRACVPGADDETVARVQRAADGIPFLSFDRGDVQSVTVGGVTFARAVLRPGWRWSVDMKPIAGTDSCQVAHVALVTSGAFHVQMDDGDELELGPGDAHVVGRATMPG